MSKPIGKLDIWMGKRPLPALVVYDSIRIFLLEHCTIRATALAYTSLLAAVPLLILLTSISLSLGIGDLFIKHLPAYLPEFLEKVAPYVEDFIDLSIMTGIILDNVMPFLNQVMGIRLGSFGIIGGIGLFVTFILAIDTIETNMNIIWGINETRSYFQKVVVFIPFLLLLVAGIGVISIFLRYVRDALNDVLVQRLSFGEFGNMLVNMTIPVSLLVIALLGLWFLYCYMPYVPERKGFWRAALIKTKKRWSSAFISAIFTFVAVSVFTLVMAFLKASMFAKWSLFYGSLATIPMIMFFLFGFWNIILFGNTLCWRITEKNRPRKYFLDRIADLSRN
ncbi:MAG: YihY/virulence factor BrkB family protein [Fibromonadaceae bacterium]|jgi:membrane protein|nr:YihY/virulence factor BrkB family protein [Fibromonadaceae bacterium]